MLGSNPSALATADIPSISACLANLIIAISNQRIKNYLFCASGAKNDEEKDTGDENFVALYERERY
jgi:hypothetical protein